ncbi:hypothetical protein C8R44DRAFT_938713 [Mycena epipterygia]|nr:hypothetical protein C8R44DRAFT_938713 [Mycena epipterygia]
MYKLRFELLSISDYSPDLLDLNESHLSLARVQLGNITAIFRHEESHKKSQNGSQMARPPYSEAPVGVSEDYLNIAQTKGIDSSLTHITAVSVYPASPSMIFLLDFPTELLMEIVKYFPAWYSAADARIQGVHSVSFGHYVLRAFSQTCRRLRRILLPLLWARVNACWRGPWIENRMINIRKIPHLMPYIRSLSITLRNTMENYQLIEQFLRALQLLPDLRSLTILDLPKTMACILTTSCKDMVFPSVASLALPEKLAPILRCFPNVRTLTAVESSHDSLYKLLMAAKDCCEHIHTLNDLRLGYGSYIVNLGLRETIPQVKRLTIWRIQTFELVSSGQTHSKVGASHSPQAVTCMRLGALLLYMLNLPPLEGMDNLSELWVRHSARESNCHTELGKVIEAGKRVLQTSKAAGRKELRIQHLDVLDIIEEETLFILHGIQWTTATNYPMIQLSEHDCSSRNYYFRR